MMRMMRRRTVKELSPGHDHGFPRNLGHAGTPEPPRAAQPADTIQKPSRAQFATNAFSSRRMACSRPFAMAPHNGRMSQTMVSDLTAMPTMQATKTWKSSFCAVRKMLAALSVCAMRTATDNTPRAVASLQKVAKSFRVPVIAVTKNWDSVGGRGFLETPKHTGTLRTP